MKNIKIVFPALLLLCAGIFMTGCPSDPDPIKPIEDSNMVFEGGKYQFLFDTPKIEHGREYEVILTLENYDSDFVGSHLGGKLCYKMDMDDGTEDAKILGGWANSTPDTVSKNVKTYKWTFTAGEDTVDNAAEDPANTPDGATQFFALTAQDSNWHDYPASANFRIKGSFEVKAKVIIDDWTSEGEITLGNDDGTVGKGTLSDDDMLIIDALPADSKIVITVEGVTVGAVGSNSNEPGWGIGSIGGWVSWKDPNDPDAADIDSVAINIPKNAPEGDDYTFTVEIKISDIRAVFPAGAFSTNIWNGSLTKAELFRPGN